jgi:hypothetical protein
MSKEKKQTKKGILMPPAVGYSFQILLGFVFKYKIDFRFVFRFIITVVVNIINWPFRTYERLIINPKYKRSSGIESPIFILGHWRSGTTHLHNLLCKDPQMGYTTTYQSVFPDTLFNKLGYFLFEGFARFLIPGKRAGDNVTLGTELPQEEEFALGDKTPISFYYFWMFPRKIRLFYKRFIRFEGIDNAKKNRWKANYKLLIAKSLKNTNTELYLSKNPPNTGRVKLLLEMFPNARFIHIHRNPIEVFLSTQNFLKKMLPHLQLQNISQKEINKELIHLYEQIMTDYFQQKSLIPEGNLVEVRFEDLEKNPMSLLKRVYSELDISGFESAEPGIQDYVNSMKSYKKNNHVLSKKQLDILIEAFDFTMKKLNYSVPLNIDILEDEV